MYARQKNAWYHELMGVSGDGSSIVIGGSRTIYTTWNIDCIKKLVSTDYSVYDYTPGTDPTPSPTPIIPTPTPVPDPTPTPTPFVPFENLGGISIVKPSGEDETYVVPDGVDRLRVDLWGAGGGSGRYFGRNAAGSAWIHRWIYSRNSRRNTNNWSW